MIITIGPVQEYIASARRSRDLWFGSWFLSELSKAAAAAVLEASSNDTKALVFPSVNAPQDLAPDSDIGVVNKIVALISSPPEEVGRQAHARLLTRLKQIRDSAFRGIDSLYFHRSIAEAQVEDMVEFFWAAAPLKNPQDNREFSTARSHAESLLAARKTTRDFAPVTWGNSVPKSSLDGQRESVIDEEAYAKLSAEHRYNQYGLRQAERLCGVGLLKRHGNRAGDDSFVSTSHMAALPLLETFSDKAALQDYIRELTAIVGIIEEKEVTRRFGKVPPRAAHPAFSRYDGHLLFEERLADLFVETGPGVDRDLKRARLTLQSFLARAFGGKRPSPYYALLLADGDSMGKAIDSQRSIEQHRAFSRRLGAFAGSVRSIVETEHKGSLIYAGGDDVLAFVPLHTVLPCARRLATTFADELSSFKITEDSREYSPTLSVGVAVTHHIEPLSDALRLAREAEKTAKSLPGKNALAVTVSKRSGTERMVCGKWGTLDRRLTRFAELHRTDAMPDGAAYELRDLAMRLEGLSHRVLSAEAMRILGRKRAQGGENLIAGEVIAELSDLVDDPTLTLQQLADELIISRIFADAAAQAGLHSVGVIKPSER
ncbi:MAG: type III-B CRISPR-associated protein Cas10/Cmr2 [Acidobacteria bacterium]|nr:type III-B CRISPR-associated protein Cas10/Cmr2 [Acidobacteriota bacterium]MCW5971348.1 type III-B CRISPR-associated protein Cas10/Cmr2 [Blastocatellales bacterium]